MVACTPGEASAAAWRGFMFAVYRGDRKPEEEETRSCARRQSDGTRLIRRKTTRYVSHEQRAQIRFMYEKYQHGRESIALSTILLATFSFPVNCACFSSTPGTKSRKRSAIIAEAHLGRILA